MRRDGLIKKIEELKASADTDVISIYNDIISELSNEKKYGIVWEREIEKEKIVQECLEKIPSFSIDKSKTVLHGGENHLLIEGDNFHSLLSLNLIYKNSVDIIFIDPPYNTGKEDFIYNDKFVGQEDEYRHSKWLQFMDKRLRLSKDLIKEDGVIFICIDDHEQANLKILCDEIFSEDSFINCFMWLHGKGKKNKQSRTLQQYVLAYCKSGRDNLNSWSMIRKAQGTFSNPDNDPNGPWFSGSISFSEERSNKKSEKYFEITSPSGITWTRQWMCTKEEMDDYLAEGKIYFGEAPDYSNTPRIKIYPDEENELIPDNIIDNCSSTRQAEKQLNDIIGKKLNDKGKLVAKFDNPKPSDLIQHLISITNKENDIVVLDFFAGSGTTGQAVLELNKEDEGKRKFILCTNNENNICKDVTYPRLKTVITGEREDGSKYSSGLPGTLHYLKTDFAKNSNNSDQAKYSLAEKIDVLLCVKENLFNLLNKSSYFTHYANDEKDKHLFIYNDYYIEEEFNTFLNEIKTTTGHKIVYVFDTSEYVDKTLFNGIEDIEIYAAPSKMYDIYDSLIEEIKRN